MSDEPYIPTRVRLQVPIVTPRELHIVLTYESEAEALAAFRQMKEHFAVGDAVQIQAYPRAAPGHA